MCHPYIENTCKFYWDLKLHVGKDSESDNSLLYSRYMYMDEKILSAPYPSKLVTSCIYVFKGQKSVEPYSLETACGIS